MTNPTMSKATAITIAATVRHIQHLFSTRRVIRIRVPTSRTSGGRAS